MTTEKRANNAKKTSKTKGLISTKNIEILYIIVKQYI